MGSESVKTINNFEMSVNVDMIIDRNNGCRNVSLIFTNMGEDEAPIGFVLSLDNADWLIKALKNARKLSKLNKPD